MVIEPDAIFLDAQVGHGAFLHKPFGSHFGLFVNNGSVSKLFQGGKLLHSYCAAQLPSARIIDTDAASAAIVRIWFQNVQLVR